MSTRPIPDWRAAQVADLAVAIAAADGDDFASDEEVRAVLTARAATAPTPEPTTRETPDPAQGER